MGRSHSDGVCIGPNHSPVGRCIYKLRTQGHNRKLATLGIAALCYMLNKRMTVGIVEHSGVQSQLVFKRSVLEGLQLDEASSAQASDVLQWLMDAARTGKRVRQKGLLSKGISRKTDLFQKIAALLITDR